MSIELTKYTSGEKWADIVPIPLDEGQTPPVPIAYSEEFTVVMNYFRAILAKNELSERATELVRDVIALNPANYTAWIFLRQCLEALGSDLDTELKYCEEIAEQNPKNYQIWHHRRELVTLRGTPGNELAVTALALNGDNKNYHVWSHRQWVLTRFNVFENELKFTTEMITQDVRNNSAWNQRMFVLTKTSGLTASVITDQVTFVTEQIELAPSNDSPWRFLEGLIHSAGFDTNIHKDMFVAIAEGVLQKTENAVNARAFLVELYACTGTEEDKARARTLCDELAVLDAIRARYWTVYRKPSLEAL